MVTDGHFISFMKFQNSLWVEMFPTNSKLQSDSNHLSEKKLNHFSKYVKRQNPKLKKYILIQF